MIKIMYNHEEGAKYKVGDKVRVKEYEDIKDLNIECGDYGVRLPSHCWFVDAMREFCGNEYIIQEIRTPREVDGELVGFYRLYGASTWCFTDEMLEDDNAKLISCDQLNVSFDDFVI